MKTQKFYDTCYEAAQATPCHKELTYGSNGYPAFGGISRFAYYGFENFVAAEALVDYLGCGTIEQIHFRDGWQLAESRGVVWEAMKISAEDYGCNYSEWELGNELSFLKEQIADAESFADIIQLVENFNELLDEFNAKDDDEVIVVDEGRYYDTLKTPTMNWTHDTHNYHIAVVINSDDFPIDDEI